MEDVESPDQLDVFWAGLDRSNNSLPPTLRPPQRDALFHIRNKHVLLCVGTGLVDINSQLFAEIGLMVLNAGEGKSLVEACATLSFSNGNNKIGQNNKHKYHSFFS